MMNNEIRARKGGEGKGKRVAHLEGKVSRVLVESAAVEEGEDVAADLGGDDGLAGEGAHAAVGEGRRDHRDRLAVYLHRTALPKERLSDLTKTMRGFH